MPLRLRLRWVRPITLSEISRQWGNLLWSGNTLPHCTNYNWTSSTLCRRRHSDTFQTIENESADKWLTQLASLVVALGVGKQRKLSPRLLLLLLISFIQKTQSDSNYLQIAHILIHKVVRCGQEGVEVSPNRKRSTKSRITAAAYEMSLILSQLR